MNTRIPQGFMAAAVAALVFAGTAQAQERPFEVSLDGGLAYTTFDVSESLTQFVLPFQQARLSLYVAPQWAVEGAVLYDYMTQDEDSQSQLLLVPGMSYYFAPVDAGENRTYVTVAVGCTGGRHR
ncbi:MAG: hypothetical protein ACLFWG_02965, partial [Longimicrobiales bacterium]